MCWYINNYDFFASMSDGINVSVKMAAKFLNFTSSLKVVLLVFFLAMGVYKQRYVPIGCLNMGWTKNCYSLLLGSFPEDSRHPFEGTKFSPAGIALSFFGILFAYDGW